MLHPSFEELTKCLTLLNKESTIKIIGAIGSYLLDTQSVFKQVIDESQSVIMTEKSERYLAVIFGCLYDEIEKIHDRFGLLSLTRFNDSPNH